MLIGAIGAILYFKKNICFISIFSNKLVQLFLWILFIFESTNIIHIPLPIAHEVVSIDALSMII
jgi:hypothetical protein